MLLQQKLTRAPCGGNRTAGGKLMATGSPQSRNTCVSGKPMKPAPTPRDRVLTAAGQACHFRPKQVSQLHTTHLLPELVTNSRVIKDQNESL